MKTMIKMKKIIIDVLWKIGYVVILERPSKKIAFKMHYGEVYKN
jgi:hypothetical protein